jgi:nitroreductase
MVSPHEQKWLLLTATFQSTMSVMGVRHPPLSFPRIVAGRRATPAFSPARPVTEEHLKLILSAGLHAPSSYNLQPWRFVVVRDAAQRGLLRAAAMNQEQVEQAPVVIVACGDTEGWRRNLETVIDIGRQHGFTDESRIDQKRANVMRDLASHPNMSMWVTKQTMIAATTMMWMAEALGYDTGPMEGFIEEEVRQVLNIPAYVCVMFLLAIGRLKGPDSRFSGRLPPSTTVYAERYGEPIDLDIANLWIP